MEEKEYKQLCVWPGTVVGEEKIKDFESFMKEEFDVRIKYEAEIKTNPTPGEEVSGGRNDLFFYVHNDDLSKFAIPRLKAGIRWWEDIFFNDQGYLYPLDFTLNHPTTW